MTVDELLAQATCAVRAGSSGDHGDAVGTAWLAKDDGHLLTAGHVVKDMLAAGEVWVRFPDTDSDERATFAINPVHDKPAALDFAVLRLDEPNRRRPLPFTLVSRAEGPVRARGYGKNLPKAQSGGQGTLLGHYLRGHSSATFLFQYLTNNLSIPGFSGAAVHSDVANAVIGLQVEEEGGRSAFAMPLARIADYWADLVSAATKPTRGLCVLVQPRAASDEARDIVRERIIRPVLESLNLALYVSELGRTLHEDLRQLELADVVIADVTHFDPSVIYELTVAQGLGTPDVVVIDKSAAADGGGLFQFVELDPDDLDASRRLIEQRLVSVRSIFEALGEISTTNPLTSFFKAPLTQISAANALALGYELNFVRPVGHALLKMADGGPGTVTVNGSKLHREQLDNVTLTVVLPDSLSWANDDYIDRTLARPGRVVAAVVEHPDFSRPRSTKCLPVVSGEPIRLIDAYPTTLATMMEAIDERLGLDSGHRFLQVWKDLERKEIDRFQSKLVQRIRSDGFTMRHRSLADIVVVASASAIFPWLDEEQSASPPI
jgi:hypothetical protein